MSSGLTRSVLAPIVAPIAEALDALDRSVQARSKAGSTLAAPRQLVVVAWRAVFVLTVLLAFVKYARMLWGPRR